MLHGYDVIGCFITLVARVVSSSEPDEAEFAAENQLRPIHYGDVESFAFVDRFTRSVQTSVHTRRKVAPVSGAQRYRPVRKPVDGKKATWRSALRDTSTFGC